MSCGSPVVNEEFSGEEMILIEMSGVKPENLLVCPATGDSMIDEGFTEGDLLLLDKSLAPKQNDVILAEINGEPAVEKFEKPPRRQFGS